MKLLDNKVIMFKDAPVLGEQSKPLDTFALITVILEGSAYPSSKEIIKAARILGNVKVENNQINLEDEDFKFIKQWATVYQPIVNKGLLFREFFEQLEDN